MENADINKEIARIQKEYARREKEIPSDFYSIQYPANLYLHTQRTYEMVNLLKKKNMFPLNDKFILEIGCGSGSRLIDFQSWGAAQDRLYGIDLIEEKILKAKKSLPLADLRVGEASRLPWPDNKFDLVLQSTVFTSILDDALKKAIAQEMLRVLSPQGIIIWYDFLFNNRKNPHVRGIKAKEIRLLFPQCMVKLKRITLAPPLTHFLAPHSYLVCYLLEQLRFLNTHYLGVIKRS
jgi:ubiquinone/menaquinone biosynthesis C-methylase UbiE